MIIGIDARMYGIAQRGIGRYVQELVNHLTHPSPYEGEGKGEVMQLVLFLSPEGMRLVPDHPRVTKILAPWHWYSVAEQLHMPRLIAHAHVDLMHFTHFNVPWVCPVPYIVTLHDLILLHTNRQRATTLGPLLYSIKYAAWKILLQHTLKNAAQIIVPSQTVKDELGAWMPKIASKATVIYEGTPLSHCEERSDVAISGAPEIASAPPQRGLAMTSPYILYVGSAYPHKNLERLIEAFALLTQRVPPRILHSPALSLEGRGFGVRVNLILVGKEDYFYQRLKKDIKNHLTHPSPYEGEGKGEVIFTGEVSDEELSELYRHAALVVCPALHEGFGLPALEAAMHGAPLAVSDIPVFREILEGTPARSHLVQGETLLKTAFFFNPYDVHDIARVLQEALTNEPLRQTHIQNARTRAQSFSWKLMAQETLKIYKDLVSRVRTIPM